MESIIILGDGIVPVGSTVRAILHRPGCYWILTLFQQEEAEAKDDLAVKFGSRYFALPPQLTNAGTILSPSFLNQYRQEGLAVTEPNCGFPFDTAWGQEKCLDFLTKKLPIPMGFLLKRMEDDPKGRPSILTCSRQARNIRLAGIALPDGNAVFECTQKPKQGYRGTALILSECITHCINFFFAYATTPASRQKISAEDRECFRREIALQGGDLVGADDWDDLEVEEDSSTSDAEENTQPARKTVAAVQKRKRSRVESEEESDEPGSEAEVETQLASSSPSPRPPAKKQKFQSRDGEDVFILKRNMVPLLMPEYS